MPLNLIRKDGGFEFHDARSLVFVAIGMTFCGLLVTSAISSMWNPDKVIQVPDAFERIVLFVFGYYFGTARKNGNGENGKETVHEEPNPEVPAVPDKPGS